MARKTVDWEAIEPHWRAGIKTKLQISEEFGVSRAALDKHFAKEGIERDLTARIQAKAESLVTRAQVTRTVTPESRATEREIVESNAQMQADIIVSHRKDIQRGRTLVMSLLEELEHETVNRDLYERLGEFMEMPDAGGKDQLADIYRKVMSLPGRTDTMKKLAESLKTLVGLERQAFKIADDTPLGDGEDLKSIEVRFVRAG